MKYCHYRVADALIRENPGKPSSEQWDIAPEEDGNIVGAVTQMVYIERKERITE